MNSISIPFKFILQCRTYFILMFVLFRVMPMTAQTITISPQTGNVISAYTTASNELGYAAGYGSMWKHNQVPLTYTTSDSPQWSVDGIMLHHTCDIRVYNNSLIQIAGYYPVISTLALPQGYRILSYKIVISNNLDKTADKAVLDDVFGSKLPFSRAIAWSFGEMNKANLPTGQNSTPLTLRSDAQVSMPTNSQGQEFTLSRQDTINGLGNVLYFGFNGNNGYNNLAGFTFKSIEITFAANQIFDIPLVARTQSTTKVSLMDNDFVTRKIDIGGISNRDKNGTTYFSYSQDSVKALSASIKLYEQGAVSNGTWDATKGQQLISSISNQSVVWYGLRTGTYYIEAPTYVKLSAANGTTSKAPVGYRIVGAKFNYSYGTAVSGSAGGFVIQSSVGGVTQYLDIQGNWATTKTVWKQDSYGRVYTVSGGTNYYLYYWYSSTDGKYYVYADTTHTNYTSWGFDSKGNMYYKINGYTYYLRGGQTYPYLYYYSTTNPYATQVAAGTNFTPTNFTLTIFGKDGTTAAQTINVTSSQSGTSNWVNLTGYNNDAVKFSISTNTANADAVVQITIQLEPLIPYFRSVDVVCKGTQGEEITRRFIANTDFKIGGDAFLYKIPKGFYSTGGGAQFAFRNLISNYADNTYLNHPTTDNSRYNFVASAYYKLVNEDLYSNSSTVANYDYTAKIATNEVGNIPYAFNNAADLYNTQVVTGTKYLTERLFTMADYNASTYNSVTGNFGTSNAYVTDGQTKTMYLFTTDETRYNIAPTIKEMHKAHAYYNTTIKLQMSDYSPIVEWIPVYNQTFYLKNGVETNEKMVGALIKTTESGLDNAPYGYLTISQIKAAMEASIAAKTDANVPATMDQVLYVDNSKLFSVLTNNADGTTSTKVSTLRSALAKNALIYLPAKASTIVDGNNVAVMQGAQNATSSTNILLEDKNPFFAPYDILLNADKYATYTRQVTTTSYKNGATYMTLALPFGLTIDSNGLHNDSESGSQFTFFELAPTNSLVAVPATSGTNYLAQGVFTNVKPTSGLTVANIPYLVTVSGSPTTGEGLFVAKQMGAFIPRSTGLPGNSAFAGTASTASWTGQTMTFTSKASFAGATFDRTINDKIFYFATDKFYSIANLNTNILKMFPFRTYYEFSTPTLPSKMFSSFDISFDNGSIDSATGITEAKQLPDLEISTTQGAIHLKANRDQMVTVYSITGQSIDKTKMRAGELHSINVPFGVYVVNGMKLIVK